MLEMKYFDGAPIPSAGRHLAEKLGRENVCAIFPHMPVATNSDGSMGACVLACSSRRLRP